MKYTVLSWDGVEGTTVTSCLTPGSAAKRAVEELGFRPGHIVVIDEFANRTMWDVRATRLVYACEVKWDFERGEERGTGRKLERNDDL